MALLQKILPNRKGSLSTFERWTAIDSSKEWKNPKFNPNNVRLVIFADNERDRKLFFDSKAVKKVEPQVKKCGFRRRPVPNTNEQDSNSRPPMFHFTHPGSDVNMLEEIMFGSVGIAYTGSALKVHLTKSPPQLMLTKVFVPENPKKGSGSDLDGESYSFSSNSDPRQIISPDRNNSVAQSIPMDVPSPNQSRRATFDIIDEDSGLASLASSGSLQSFQTPFPSPGSNGSYNSLQRRKNRILYTSLEGSLKRKSSQDNLLAHEMSGPSSLSSNSSNSCKKKTKLALGILFGLNDDKKDEESNKLFENFFFSHITLLERHLEKLKAAVENAYYNKKQFFALVMEALDMFRRDVQNLYVTPRLSEPVWLNMMSFCNHRYQMSEKFIKQFMHLVGKFDNKNTNFFISTMVTAVLTNHLAWVPTVTPAGGTSIRTYLHNHSPNWVDTFAKTHPYNPLWAQLGDLYGAIGFPLKISRTVVVGKKADLVNRLLYILTYFIRCSDVNENDELGSLRSCLDDLNFDLDKQDITPIQEDEGFHFPHPIGKTINCDSSNSCTHHQLTHQNSVISIGNVSSFSSASCGSQQTVLDWDMVKNEKCDKSYALRKFVETHETKKSKKPEHNPDELNVSMEMRQIEKVEPSYDHELDFLNSDEGYSSIVPGDNRESEYKNQEYYGSKNCYKDFSAPCRLSVSQICESVPIENVKNVRRSIEDHKLKDVSSSIPANLCYNISKDNINTKQVSDIRAKYLREGSHSIFDEYFNDENIETKTIDDIEAKDRIIKHHLVSESSENQEVKVKNTTDKDNIIKHPLAPCNSIRSSTDSLSHEIKHSNVSCDAFKNSCDSLARDTSASVSVTSHTSDHATGTHDTRLGSFTGGMRPRMSSLSRQLSSGSGIPSRPTTLNPARTRSVTPTELRRRHLSSTSSVFDIEPNDPLHGYKDLDMPVFTGDTNSSSIKEFDRNYGRSLLAGYSDSYLSDFVLHGTSDTNFMEKLHNDLQVSVQHSVLDEPIGESVCVIADTDKWTVEVASSRDLDKPCITKPVIYSQLVCNLIEAVLQLWKLKMSPEFCLMHLEDRLQEIFFKSKMLAEYLKDMQQKKCDIKELTPILGFEKGDLPLLVAIAGTHSPHLSLGVV